MLECIKLERIKSASTHISAFCSTLLSSAALSIALLSMGSTPLHAELLVQTQSTTVNLLDAVNLSLENRPEWRSFQHQIAAQQQGEIQARSALLPNVILSAQTSKQDQTFDNSLLDSEGNSNFFNLRATQPLFRLDAWFNYQAAKESTQQLDFQLQSSYQSLIIDVANAYLAALRAQAQLTFAEADLNAIRQQLEQAKQRFKVGLIAITDVHEAQAAYDLAEVNQLASRTDLDIAYENLGRLTGTLIGGVKTVSEALPITNPEPNNMSHWVTLAQQENPTVQAAKSAKSASKQALRSSRSLYLPQVNLFANYSDIGSINTNNDNELTEVGVELTYPLFVGLNNQSTTRQSSLQHMASSEDLIAEIKTTQQNTRNLFRSVQTDVLRVAARKQAIKSSDSALQATEAGYEVGTRNVIDVLNAQRSLFAAKRDYATARYDYIINTLQLKQSVGQISAKEIAELNQWLDQ